MYTTPYCVQCKTYIKQLTPLCQKYKIILEIKDASACTDIPLNIVPTTIIYGNNNKITQLTAAQEPQLVINEYYKLQ